MVYRIRYCDAQGQHQNEVLVEAHNTTEAMVKFCHARGPTPGGSLSRGRVSISPESVAEANPSAEPSSQG
jgi:hypothetical protein